MEFINAGKCLKVAQAKCSINSRELAKRTGTSPQQIIRWRRNKNIKLHTLQVLTSALGITIDEFISSGYK